MSETRAVLFDADDTLWHSAGWSNENVWHTMLGEFGFELELEAVEEALKSATTTLQSEWNAIQTRGTPATAEEVGAYFRRLDKHVLDTLGLVHDEEAMIDRVEVWFGAFVRPVELFPDTTGVLGEIRRLGFRVGIVSNNFYQSGTARRVGIATYFDTIVDTGSTGYRKPMPEIYRLALDALQVEPSETVMVGDNYEDDVAGAEAAGIRGIHLVRDGAGSPAGRVIPNLWGLLNYLDD